MSAVTDLVSLAPVGLTVSTETLVIGTLTGLGYAVLGAGLVLIYRATRVINFAHGEIGAFGAAVLAKLVLDYDWNFFFALLLVAAIGGVVGALVELGIVRRLFEAPRLILLVATIGVAQIMFFAQAMLPDIDNVSRFPTGIDRSMEVGDLLLRGEHFMVLAMVPALIAGLTIFLNRTPYGIAIRASAENADAARLAGISTKRVSTLVWVLAAVLATVTAVLINPLRGVIVGQTFSAALGPGLLLRALAAALAGGLTSLPRTVIGGVALGILEAVIFVNAGEPGMTDFALFAVVLGLVWFQRRGAAADDEAGSWSLSPKIRPIPDRLRQIRWVRHLPQLVGGAALLAALVLPLVFSQSSQVFLFTRVLIFAMIALSLTVLTGWAGQLSLGQFALVGVGSFGAAALVARGMPFAPAVLYATVGGVLVALAIGAPALRVRGLHLAITTLAFAVAARGWLFTRDLFLGEQSFVILEPGTLWFLDLSSQRTLYYVSLVVLLAVVVAVARLRRSGVGRTLIAVRDNEPTAAAYTVSPATAKLAAFAVSGGIAALAGALLAALRVQFGAGEFGVEESLRVMAMTIIGGIGSIAGSILGAVYVLGLPALIQDSLSVRLLTSGIGLLVLLLYFPGGLAQIMYRARDGLLALAERQLERQGSTPTTPAAPATATPVAPTTPAASTAPARAGPRVTGDGAVSENGAAALRVEGVTVRFGGLTAVDDVSLTAEPGQVVGLIGSNGAGKSTLMNAISGFVPLERGRIEVLGTDVTGLAPHERAAVGMGRVFQDARLFGDLTVRECIQVALERRERSELIPSLLGLPPARRGEARKASEASDIVSYLGLGRYADSFISDLSTGTRRIAELACLVALQPRLLLLDEPTAGVAQRETEAFGPLIRQVQRELDATVVIIEHDMPLILSVSDRVSCLAAGRVIAEGAPEAVRSDPAVVAAYLGTDERAILRSDQPTAKRPSNGAPKSKGTTKGKGKTKGKGTSGATSGAGSKKKARSR